MIELDMDMPENCYACRFHIEIQAAGRKGIATQRRCFLINRDDFIVNASTGRAVGCPLHEIHNTNTTQTITVVVPKNATVRIEAGKTYEV